MPRKSLRLAEILLISLKFVATNFPCLLWSCLPFGLRLLSGSMLGTFLIWINTSICSLMKKRMGENLKERWISSRLAPRVPAIKLWSGSRHGRKWHLPMSNTCEFFFVFFFRFCLFCLTRSLLFEGSANQIVRETAKRSTRTSTKSSRTTIDLSEAIKTRPSRMMMAGSRSVGEVLRNGRFRMPRSSTTV